MPSCGLVRIIDSYVNLFCFLKASETVATVIVLAVGLYLLLLPLCPSISPLDEVSFEAWWFNCYSGLPPMSWIDFLCLSW